MQKTNSSLCSVLPFPGHQSKRETKVTVRMFLSFGSCISSSKMQGVKLLGLAWEGARNGLGFVFSLPTNLSPRFKPVVDLAAFYIVCLLGHKESHSSMHFFKCFILNQLKLQGFNSLPLLLQTAGQSSAAQSSVPVTEQGMQPNSWNCFLVMERRGEKGYVCKFLFVTGNLQLCCVQQALAARTHSEGHLEIYLHSLVTLCLLKGLKKISAVQASY